MVSFIIEKDEVFKNIILNEWSKTSNLNINSESNENSDNKNYKEINEKNNKNNYKNDDYDDYEDYNIKKDIISLKGNNYSKLKKDLSMNPLNNFYEDEPIKTEKNNFNKKQKFG